MNGLVTGGWSYVWAAYALSALILFGYAAKVYAANKWSAGVPTGVPRESAPERR